MLWRYLTEDLSALVPTPWVQMVLALSSVVCGAIIGAEREKRDKPAGLRTLVLVCLGSTAFTMASYAFITTTGDSGRVAAQIVTGIGFLGAGAILHSAGVIRGMTTAATIWASAAIGMIVGTGHVGAGLGMSVLVRLVLTGALVLEGRALGSVSEVQVELTFDPDRGRSRARIEKIMEEFHVPGSLAPGEPTADGMVRVTLRFRLSRRHRREFLNELAVLPQVKGIEDCAG